MAEDKPATAEKIAPRLDARDVPDGYRIEWVVAERFEVGGEGRKCRMLRCGNPAVARFQRLRHGKNGTTPVWWHYCGDHLYGRKIEDGVVKEERLVPIETPMSEGFDRSAYG